ncbi:hypothetical protein JYT51_01090 [Candidatus Amoebophilus asiaticus]|nr:hypothetical protein [Candidatus Amoebophilus asiaticus]
MKIKLPLLFFIIAFVNVSVFPQDDLLSILDEETEEASSEPVMASFKTTRLVNAHSLETVKARTLDVRITHRFGDLAGAGGGVHTLYGLDNAANIRLAVEYGASEKLTLGFGRSKIREHLDGYIKYCMVKQTTDNKMPLAITVLANTALSPMRASTDATSEESFQKQIHRFSYTFQAIIGRKFSENLSLIVMPTYLHRNYVQFDDENSFVSLGIGGRFKFTKRSALIFDYFYNFSNFRKNNSDTYFPPLGIAYEIETGGHVFHIEFTNATGIIENDFLPNTKSNWLDGGFRLAFTISRVFVI